MKDLIVKLAYKIDGSKTYHSFRTFLINILVNNTTRHKKIFDLSMIFLVISTIGILIYEVKHTLPPYITNYEYFAIFIFILEWIARFIVSFESHKQIIRDFEESQLLNIQYNLYSSIKIITKAKLSYIFSPMSIIDLLAILPSYRPLRILRIFLIFRLFKVLRYASSLNQFIRVFIEKKFELLLLLALYLLAIFFSATVLYVYEGDGLNDKVNSFIDAIYWAFITVSTIGYGDITPVSDAGKSVTLVLIITGYTIIAFFTSIVTSSISEKLDNIKEVNALSNTAKLKNYILVCGYGNVGEVLVNNLKKNRYEVLVIEQDPHRVSIGEHKKLNIIKDDATNIDLLKKVGINKNVKAVMALSNDDTVNLSIILAVRSLNKDINIIARCNRFKTKEKLKIAGANEVIDMNETAGLVALGQTYAPVAFEAIDEILINHKGAFMSEIEIFEHSEFIGLPISAIDFSLFNITFIGLIHSQNKDEFNFNPNQDEVILKKKDLLIVIGYELTLKEFQTYIQSHTTRRS